MIWLLLVISVMNLARSVSSSLGFATGSAAPSGVKYWA